MKSAIIEKGILKGKINSEPSKSYCHRELIASFLSAYNGYKSSVSNVSFSNDIMATLDSLKRLGGDIVIDNNKVYFNGFNRVDSKVTINAKESGSTLRFLIPLSLYLYKEVTIYATEKLISRGITEYERIFDLNDIDYTISDNYIHLKGDFKDYNFSLKGNISSQFITGLLLLMPLFDSDSKITLTTTLESKDYVDITIDTLKMYGVNILRFDNEFTCSKDESYKGYDAIVEGDYSNASFIEAFNYFNSSVEVLNLNNNSLQGDKRYQSFFKELNEGYKEIDIRNSIDLGPVLFVFASLKYGAKFTGIKRLRIKESNRIDDLLTELKKINVSYTLSEDEIVINKCNIDGLNNIRFDSHNDHRIAMALSLVLSITSGTILNAEAVNKSYPSYFDRLNELGLKVIYE